jgi:hypothetical protein
MAEVKNLDAPVGALTENASSDVVIKDGSNITLETGVTFDQLLLLLSMAVTGGVTPTPPTSPATLYTWVFEPVETEDPVPDTFTLELQESDGTAFYAIQVPYCFITELAFSGGLNDFVKLTAKVVGRKAADMPSGITADIPVTEVEIATTPATAVYIDDTWATLGGTKVSGQIIGHKVTDNTGLMEAFRLEGRTDKDFSKYQFKRHGVTATLTMEFAASATAERAKAADRSLRFVRIEYLGADDKLVWVDFCCRHAKGDFWSTGESDDQSTVDLNLIPAYDPTSGKSFSVTVKCLEATLPGEGT